MTPIIITIAFGLVTSRARAVPKEPSTSLLSLGYVSDAYGDRSGAWPGDRLERIIASSAILSTLLSRSPLML
jgi:hypothetical protein